MKHSTDRILTTHVGSLIRPAPLQEFLRAKQAGKLPPIGILGASTPSDWRRWVAAFVQRLSELGWNEGRTIAIEYGWAEGQSEQSCSAAISLPY